MIRAAAFRTSLEFLEECVRQAEEQGLAIILVIRSALIRWRGDLHLPQRDRLIGRDGAEASSQK